MLIDISQLLEVHSFLPYGGFWGNVLSETKHILLPCVIYMHPRSVVRSSIMGTIGLYGICVRGWGLLCHLKYLKRTVLENIKNL